jgi:hypothetical protein
MRPAFAFVVVLLVAGCGGDDWVRATETTSGGVSFAIEGVPVDQTELRVGDWPSGPTTGWATAGNVQFFVRTPKQTVDHPARLTFTIDADLLEEQRGHVDQLGVSMPNGLVLVPESYCDRADGRAEPDPCMAASKFLENGDGRIVVLASDPVNGCRLTSNRRGCAGWNQ